MAKETRMDWSRLLSTERQSKMDPLLVRNEDPFWQDYISIISSESFRRLQDKTQVFALDKSDYVRTRLTHSLEVSSYQIQ